MKQNEGRVGFWEILNRPNGRDFELVGTCSYCKKVHEGRNHDGRGGKKYGYGEV